jgi:hypothetical protein
LRCRIGGNVQREGLKGEFSNELSDEEEGPQLSVIACLKKKERVVPLLWKGFSTKNEVKGWIDYCCCWGCIEE